MFPRNGISISADYVASVRVGSRPPHSVENWAYAPLSPGVVSPSHSKTNVVDGESLHRALTQTVQRTGLLRKEVNLLVPDISARVFLFSLESLPSRSGDFLDLLRFKVKKSLPFSVEEAALSYSVQTLGATHLEVILTVINKSVLREYEIAVESLGLQPGFVTVEHFGIAQLLDLQAQDWRSRSTLLFRLAPRSFTTSIYHQGYLRFYRAVEKDYSVNQASNITPESLFDEIYPSLAYFQDKFESKIEMMYLSGLPGGNERVYAALQKLAGCPAAEVRAERAVGTVSGRMNSDQVNQMFAPLIGMELGAT
ncbi:MAG: type IV pilus biogenesis protein PilM [Terriglobia bacterium]